MESGSCNAMMSAAEASSPEPGQRHGSRGNFSSKLEELSAAMEASTAIQEEIQRLSVDDAVAHLEEQEAHEAELRQKRASATRRAGVDHGQDKITAKVNFLEQRLEHL